MQSNETATISVQRAMEELRQERETFDQRKIQEARWFLLRMVMGYCAVVLLTSIMALSSYIFLYSNIFSDTVVAAAGTALFVDVLGLLAGVWKIALNPSFLTKLEAVTRTNNPGNKNKE